MAKEREMVRLLPRELLRDAHRQATSMHLPLPVHMRLGALTELAEDVAATRAEVVAMLITEADLDPDELAEKVLSYRKKTVEDVLPPSASQATPAVAAGLGNEPGVIQIVTPPRGRPRKNARSIQP